MVAGRVRVSHRPIRRIVGDPAVALPEGGWPLTIPAVVQLLNQGLEPGGLTVIVGDNGSGKSTIVEGIAMAFGMSPEGGSTLAAHSTRGTESSLHSWVRITRGVGGSRWGYFIRAETMHGLYTYLEENRSLRGDNTEYHRFSHGESVMSLIGSRFSTSGLYVLDEPEAGLAFETTLALALRLWDLARDVRSQVIIATHSPILAAIPGAQVYEVGPWGWRPAVWEELPLVQHWRRFLSRPEAYLDPLDASD